MNKQKNTEIFLHQEYSDAMESASPDEDWACIVLPNLDYDSQLIAIRHLLLNHENFDNELTDEIREVDDSLDNTCGARDDYIEHLHGERCDKLHSSVYQSAAHSMAAVGMLAPLMESIFFQSFIGIKKEFFRESPDTSQKCETWDCHLVWDNNNKRKNLAEGIIQLSEAIGLRKYLPNNIERILKVLFGYRNKIFHCGFEWPFEERIRFNNRMKEENWPSHWIESATSGGEPWVFYLSRNFIWHCVEVIEQIIQAISHYIFEISGLEREYIKYQNNNTDKSALPKS